MNPQIPRAYQLTMTGSRDYDRLAELVPTQSVICLVDYRVDDIIIREVARSFFQSRGDEGLWSVGTRGLCYVTAFSQAQFKRACADANLEFLEPASA